MLYDFNYEKLVNAVCDKGYTGCDVADILGISEKLYLLKLCNKEEFTMDEIRVLAEKVLEIPPEMIPEYFFRRSTL